LGGKFGGGEENKSTARYFEKKARRSLALKKGGSSRVKQR